jgi:antirestriction protein ArdC
MGGTIRRGSKGMPIIFWQIRDGVDRDGKAKRDFLLRFFTVFNVAQTERIALPPPVFCKPFDPIARCESIVAGYQGAPRIEHGGSRAYYSPPEDRIQMPPRDSFFSAPDYYSVLFHELSHSTGAATRLNRSGVADLAKFGRHAEYAKEELVAEVASAFLSADAGIAPAVIDQSSSYIAGWLKALQNDPRMVIEASALAQRATELILGREARAEEAIAEAA